MLTSSTPVEVPVERKYRVPRALAARAKKDRAVVDRAEQLDPHVDLRSVAQAPRTQLYVFVRVAIGAKRPVVVHAACHICPMTAHNFAVSGLLKIENVERLRRASDDVGSLLRSLRHAPSLEVSGDSPKRGYIGAGG